MRVCILNTYETSLINDIILSHNENVTIFNTPPTQIQHMGTRIYK